MVMISSYQIEGYRWRRKDCCRTEFDVGLCEIQGRRDDQQDALAVRTQDLTGFTGLTPAVRAQVLEDTVAEMQAAYGGSFDGGSTLCGAIAWQDRAANQIHIESINVGDSAAYLVLLDRDNQLLESIEQLKFDHSTIPAQVNLCDYEKRKVELNTLLNAYETKLTQNKSKRHLSSYNTFKATLDTREETPNLAESLQSHASSP